MFMYQATNPNTPWTQMVMGIKVLEAKLMKFHPTCQDSENIIEIFLVRSRYFVWNMSVGNFIKLFKNSALLDELLC